jgi:hypothetical protein
MKLIFRWWSWRNGRNERSVDLPETKCGYVSKPAWDTLRETLKELQGKKVRIEVDA